MVTTHLDSMVGTMVTIHTVTTILTATMDGTTVIQAGATMEIQDLILAA